MTPAAISALLNEAVKYELEDFQHNGWGLQYRVHRVDPKEDSIREIIETSDGTISRILTHKGRPLTPEEEEGERQRLRSLTPEDVRKRQQRSDSNDKYGVELIRVLPRAMTFTLAPGQPQLSRFPHSQIVLDYTPNPAFRPGSTVQALLTGVAGRMWLDAETHHLLRIELRIIRNLNLMFGVLARVYEGGTLSYEQKHVASGHYIYTEIQMDVKLRELMVHVAPYRQTLTTTSVRYFPAVPSLQEAVNSLLAIPAVKE